VYDHVLIFTIYAIHFRGYLMLPLMDYY